MKITLRKKKLKGGRTSLYLDIYHLGKRRYEYLNLYIEKSDKKRTEKIKLAEGVRATRELELANNNYGFIPEFKKRASLINYFEQFIHLNHSNDVYINTIKHLKSFADKDISFQDVDEKWLESFKRYLLSKVSKNTAASYFSILKQVFRTAKREKIISINPAEDIPNIKKRDIKREYLDIEEVRKLAGTDCANKEVKKAFLFSCFTGLRYSDVVKLKWGDIKNNTIEIRQTKTMEIIHLPLSKSAQKILFGDNVKIFQLPEKHVFSLPQPPRTNQVLKIWFEKAGINKNGHFHMGRHTFATLSLTANADLYTVSKLLGHTDIKTTQIYAKIVDAKKKEAVDNLPEIEVNL